MANLKDVIYLSNEDYETLVTTGTVTIDGTTLTYDENCVYITPDKLASSSEDGLMSASDKSKLDGVAPGATANVGTVTSVRVQATSPVVSSTSTAQTSTLNTTISLANGYGDTKNPYASKTANYVLASPNGSAGVPTFRALVVDDIPDGFVRDIGTVNSSDVISTTFPSNQWCTFTSYDGGGRYFAYKSVNNLTVWSNYDYYYNGYTSSDTYGAWKSSTTSKTYALTTDIPTVNNGGLTIQKNGTIVQTFTANQSSNVTANITVPTKTSDLTNDSGFLTSESDTLATVTGRGASTSTAVTMSGGVDVSDGTLKMNILNAKTGSSSTTYGPGTSVQVLKSNGTNAYWGNDSSDTTSQIIGAYYKWKNQMAGYQVFITNKENKLVPMVTGASGSATTATTKTMNTESFDPFGLIGYTSSSSYRAADALCSNSTYVAASNCDIRYSFNCGSTLTSNAPVYIVAQMQSDGQAKLVSPYYTQSLPTSDDGLIYIYLGQTISTTSINLQESHSIYYYKEGKIRLFTIDLANVSITGSYNDLSDKPTIPTDTNQKVKAGSVTFGNNDVVDIVAGSNVTVTGLASGTGAPKITISATNTGATSIETTGSGNVVSSASYDSSTRKITLTKGVTALTSESDTLGTVLNRGNSATKDINLNNKDFFNAGTQKTAYSYSTSQTPNTQYYWFKITPPPSNASDRYLICVEGDVNYPRGRGTYILDIANYSNGTSYNVSLNNVGSTMWGSTHLLNCAIDSSGNVYIQANAAWTSYLRFIRHNSNSTTQSYTSVGSAAFGTVSGFTSLKMIIDCGTIRLYNGAIDTSTSNSGFTTIDAEKFRENGTYLEDKYLGKTAKAADADKLDGNDSTYFQKALPTTTTAGKVLKSTSTAGTVQWADDSNTNTWRNVQVDGTEKLGTSTSTGALNFVSANTNNGDVTFTYSSGIKATAKIPTSLKNPNAIKIQGGGQDVSTYDGSSAKTFNWAASTTAGAFTISDGTTTKTIQLAGVFTDTNYYPIRSYTSGLKISTYSGSQNCELYVPEATENQSGVISTNNQTFKGLKTFKNHIAVKYIYSQDGSAQIATFNNQTNGLGPEVGAIGHFRALGDADESTEYKPSNQSGFTGDLDAFYFNTGITILDCDNDTYYNYSFPNRSGTLGLQVDIVDLTSL